MRSYLIKWEVKAGEAPGSLRSGSSGTCSMVTEIARDTLPHTRRTVEVTPESCLLTYTLLCMPRHTQEHAHRSTHTHTHTKNPELQ